jgi:anti-sigma regulatory factor (Ser/Thr protein kinase)
METFLIDRWLHGTTPEATLDEASVAVARERVRAEGAAIGMTVESAARLATAVSELGHNQLRHARFGSIAVRRIARAGVAGLEVIAADRGDGIADVSRIGARVSRPPGAASLGIGLSAVLELSDEVDFDVRLGEGTCVWARKFAGSVPHARSVALFGRPIDGEPRSGDDAAFVRFEDGALLLALADGLGHGREARSAASDAVAGVLGAPDSSLDAMFERCHATLARSRGAVMSVVRLAPGGAVDVGMCGNVSVRKVGRRPGGEVRFAGPSFALGTPGPAPRMRVEHDVLDAHELLVAFSDGLSSRLAVDASLFGEPPVVAARKLLDEFSDGRDDALVAVVR